MTDISGISSGALSAYSLKQAVTASNIAKLNTTDSAAASVVMQSGKDGGVTASVVEGFDKVDISREAVDLATTGTAFKANIKVLSTSEEMNRTLFSIKA
ncbi:MAG TPA: hypothetical protein DCZ63_04235 [Geobacter sp.]|nr:hypothetical protein [Geobacter sp.]